MMRLAYMSAHTSSSIKMQEFILGLQRECEECPPGSCWWDKTIGTCANFETCCKRHIVEQGKIVVYCGACGKQNNQWDGYDIFEYCGDRPWMWCSECNHQYILCVNTMDYDPKALCQHSCCRVLTQAEQHRIPNFEQVVFRDGKSLCMVFIACHALAITHLSPFQFKEISWLVPKNAEELATKASLVELKEPVYDFGGHDYSMDYRGMCAQCHREVLDCVYAD